MLVVQCTHLLSQDFFVFITQHSCRTSSILAHKAMKERAAMARLERLTESLPPELIVWAGLLFWLPVEPKPFKPEPVEPVLLGPVPVEPVPLKPEPFELAFEPIPQPVELEFPDPVEFEGEDLLE
jgi:hypothetical protein